MDLNADLPKASKVQRLSELIFENAAPGMPVKSPKNLSDLVRAKYMIVKEPNEDIVKATVLRRSQSVDVSISRRHGVFPTTLDDINVRPSEGSGRSKPIERCALTSTTQKKAKVSKKDTMLYRCFFLALLVPLAIVLVLVLVVPYISKTYLKDYCVGPQTYNLSRLASELRENLFGQHLVPGIVSNALKEYVSLPPGEVPPLVLSFHGPSGIGKTFTAQVLAGFLAAQGANVQWYFHRRQSVGEWIMERMIPCDLNVFIFDDVDMEGGTSELHQLLNVWDDLGVAGHSRTVFVTTSNHGAKLITDLALRRGSQVAIYESDVQILKQDGGIRGYGPHSVFVPFFPLEKEHVIRCLTTIAAGYNMKVTEETILNFATHRVKYFPESFPIFSKIGCKQLQFENF